MVLGGNAFLIRGALSQLPKSEETQAVTLQSALSALGSLEAARGNLSSCSFLLSTDSLFAALCAVMLQLTEAEAPGSALTL